LISDLSALMAPLRDYVSLEPTAVHGGRKGEGAGM
jgi:hypothetical protein